MKTALSEKKETKVVLLFTPEELARNCSVLEMMHIEKSSKGIAYSITELNRKEVERQFANLPQQAKALLYQLQADQLNNLKKETEARFKKQKAGVAVGQLVTQSIHRHIQQQFAALKPFYDGMRCYHKIRKPGTTSIQTLACRFNPANLQLRFTVIKQKDLFSLDASIVVNESVFPLSSFIRTAFVLQKENEYFLLSFKDYQTLEWLRENLYKQEGLAQPDFVEKILSKIEVDYKVNRNDVLEEKNVEVRPSCRVLLSELNNSFLLLTPQWLYDGILVEGNWKEKQAVTIRGERIIISRHKETEEEFLAVLVSLHPNFSNQRNGYYYVSFADAQKKQWFMKAYYRLLELNVEVAGMDMLHHFRYSPHPAETLLTVKKHEASLVHITMTVHFGKETVPFSTLQKALYAGQRAIVLKDGSLGVLNDEWLEKYAAIVKHGKLQDGEIRVSKFLAFKGADEGGEQAALQLDVKKEWWQQWQQWQTTNEPVFALPSSVNAALRSYQQKGFEWLVLLSQIGAGACLADDMGLGKTLQAICFLAWYYQQQPDQRHIIVCPTSLLYNWQNELKKFAPTLRAEVYHGANRTALSENVQIVITSYGTLRNNSDYLLSHQFGVAVIDESHNIKNPSAQITRVTQQIEAAIRIALSGTPVVNNTFDLYAQLSFALPGLFGSREFFKREYADPIDRWGDEAKIKALQKLTAPFILRRTKEQVATDLPEKTEAVIWCTMSAAQEEVYNEVKEQIRSNLFLDIKNNGLGKTKLAVLQGLLKLRQICNHPQLLSADEHAGRLDSAKTELLLEELSNLLGRHKVLVFSQFSSMLHLLAAECEQKNMAYFLLDGQTPAEKRMQMVKEFQENEAAPPLFLISLKAGNTGLTLTAADYVFLFDPWWNTAVEQQAVDRTHRIGQTKNVFSYKLVCKNTIEEKILELQQRKKHLAEELIGAEEDFVTTLGEDDIAYLFG